MRVERVYDWKRNEGLTEHDPRRLDPKVKAPATVRLGHLSDTHLGKGESGERQREMRRWLEAFTGLECDAVVHSGDLVEDPRDEEMVDWALSTLDDVSVPVFGVPGNHDVQKPGETNVIVERWGPFPRAEAIGDLRLFLTNSMAWPFAEERNRREQEAADDSGFWSRGGLGPEQRDRLADGLQKPWPGAQVLVVHHHLRQPVPPKPWYEHNADLMEPLADANELIEMARDAGAELVLHGHRHQDVPPFAPFEDMVILNSSSSTRKEWPKRARVIDVAAQGGAARIWELVRWEQR